MNEKDPSEGCEDLTVGEVARLVGVSVRTLHHWDAIGLAVPSGRSWSGYRLYRPDDLERLQQVLVYRETGMPLARIGEVLDDPGTSALEHLRHQHTLLRERITRLQRMVRAVEELTDKETRMNGSPTTPEQRAQVLGTGWDPVWQEEAEERWGATDDWKVSAARQAAQTPQQREEARARLEQVERDLAEAKRCGVRPGSDRANALAEQHRASLTWFDVTPAKHVLLARGYVGDPRFAAHYDALEPGLAAWLKEVIDAAAATHGVDPATAVWQ